MDVPSKRINFVEITLLNKILESGSEFQSQTCISRSAKLLAQYDGFMSSIYMLDFIMQSANSGKIDNHSIMVKLMKGSDEFRRISRAKVQFSNEIVVYSKIIPTLKQFLESESVASLDLDPYDWIPKVYYADYGLYPELGDDLESILATKNLAIDKYRIGPAVDLDELHLRAMINTIAEYHAVQYALKIKFEHLFRRMQNHITSFPYIDPDNERNIFSVLYKIAIDRFLCFYDRTYVDGKETKFRNDVEILRKNYGGAPLKLMSKFECDDSVYNVLLHGDYNRNNMLFKYVNESPVAMKMLDFQLTRYGSPACDLTYFMYLNMNPNLRDYLWDSLLDQYHSTLIGLIARILQVTRTDKILDAYSKDSFLKNFAKFAFFGVMTAMQFLPWVMCSPQHAKQISELFVNNMQGEEFYDFAMIMGGDAPKERIMQIFQHASRMGYTDILRD